MSRVGGDYWRKGYDSPEDALTGHVHEMSFAKAARKLSAFWQTVLVRQIRCELEPVVILGRAFDRKGARLQHLSDVIGFLLIAYGGYLLHSGVARFFLPMKDQPPSGAASNGA